MEQIYKPIDIAKKLNISTDMLRYYEEEGLVPPPNRMDNQYRQYNPLHVLYFEAVQAMSISFPFDVIRSIMSDIQHDLIDDALWSLNHVHVQNRADYNLLDRLKKDVEEMDQDGGRLMRIGDLAKELAVSNTALRYWEKQAYIRSKRKEGNQYRYYSKSACIKAGILKILQRINYSSEVVALKDRLKLGSGKDEMKSLIIQTEDLLNKRNVEQLQGTHYLYLLINYVKHM